jgi:ribonuclease-3 family protein
VKFDQYELLAAKTFGEIGADGAPQPRFAAADAAGLHPLVLAYVGDAFFNLFVRTRLLAFEQNRVRVLHGHGARRVSATLQAYALRRLEDGLTEDELAVVRRGRNAKSTVPKSASVSDYRASTGFEALLGYLYLSGDEARLTALASDAFVIISRKLSNPDENGEEKK